MTPPLIPVPDTRAPADATRVVPPPTPNMVKQIMAAVRQGLKDGYSRDEISTALQGKYGFTLDAFERQTKVSPRNLARAGTMGATLGAFDEMFGQAQASMEGPGNFFQRASMSLAKPRPSREAYVQSRDAIRQPYEIFREAHPVISGGTELLGGLLLPAGGAAKPAPGLLRAFGRGALVGGATGAAAGAGYAPELEDVPGAMARGGGLGALLGGTVSAGGEGLLRALRGGSGLRLERAIEAGGGEQALRRAAGEAVEAGRGRVNPVGSLSPYLRGEAEFAATRSPAVFGRYGPKTAQARAGDAERLIRDVSEILPPTAVPSRAASLEAIRGSLSRRGAGEGAADLAEELLDNGALVDADGMVTLYHRTTPEAAQRIRQTGRMAGKEDGVFFSTSRAGQAEGFGPAVVEVRVPIEKLQLDDVFGGEAHVRIPTRRAGVEVPVQVVGPPKPPPIGREALVAQRAQQFGPIYEALAETTKPLSGENAQQFVGILNRPYIKRAYQEAVDEGLLQGAKEAQPGFRAVNNLRQHLRGAQEKAFAASDGARGAAFRSAADDLESLMESGFPEFREIQNAYREASRPVNIIDLAKLETSRQGRVAPVLDQASRDLRRDLLNAFGSPARYRAFMRRVAKEGELAQFTAQVFGGSKTARVLSSPGGVSAEDIAGAVTRGTLVSPGLGVANILGRVVPQAAHKRAARQMAPLLFAPSSQIDDVIRRLRTLQREQSGGPFWRGVAPASLGLLSGRDY